MGNIKRKKIVPNRLFKKLWMDAEKITDKREFVNKYLSTLSKEYVDFKKIVGLEHEESVMLLNEIYEKQHMTFKEILNEAGKRKADIVNTFCIPIRTVEEWYTGKNKCAGYVRFMLLKHYRLISLGKYIYLESEEEYNEIKPHVYKKK